MTNKLSGLSSSEIECILSYVKKFPQIKRVILFGSRALGNHKSGSDVDLALLVDEPFVELWKFRDALQNTSPLPYNFDILIYEEISEPLLKKHIDEVGIELIT